MAEKRSPRQQAEAVDECLAVAQRAGLHPEAVRDVAAAIRTLLWLDENIDFIREVHALNQTDAVQTIRRVFPGSKMVSVRRAR